LFDLSGQTLAVLPAEVSYRGKLPKDWDADRVLKMERAQNFKRQFMKIFFIMPEIKPSGKNGTLSLLT